MTFFKEGTSLVSHIYFISHLKNDLLSIFIIPHLFIAFIVLLSIFGFSQFLAFDKSWLIQIPLSIYFNQYS